MIAIRTELMKPGFSGAKLVEVLQEKPGFHLMGCLSLDQFAQIFKTTDGIGDGAAFDAEDNIIRAFLDQIDHPLPIHHAIAAGAANRGAGDLAALGATLLH